jgi:hypothetical protein
VTRDTKAGDAFVSFETSQTTLQVKRHQQQTGQADSQAQNSFITGELIG